MSWVRVPWYPEDEGCPFSGDPAAPCAVCGHELTLFWHDEYWCDRCNHEQVPAPYQPPPESEPEPLREIPFPDEGRRPRCYCRVRSGVCLDDLSCACWCHEPGRCFYCGVSTEPHTQDCPRGMDAGHAIGRALEVLQ